MKTMVLSELFRKLAPQKHSKMKVKIKKLHENAVIPKYAKAGDAGLDLTATSKTWNPDAKAYVYGTGLAVEIPEGYVGLLFPRSSIANKQQILSNSVGVIDSGYRGEIMFKFKDTVKEVQSGLLSLFEEQYQEGERIGQLMILPYPKINFLATSDLSETDRGTGGFGSTGK